MSQAPVLDILDFARQTRTLAGTFPLASLSRLVDVLADTNGTASWQLAGSLDARGRPCMRLTVQANLHLICQRCLQPVSEPLDLDSTLRFVSEAALQDDADDEVDELVLEAGLDILALVEDELLLALPFAPRHVSCPSALMPTSDKPLSPFAALAALKRG